MCETPYGGSSAGAQSERRRARQSFASVDFGVYNLLIYATLRGLPVAAVVRFVTRPRVRGEAANLPRSFVGGLLAVYACWHVGMAAAGAGGWNPLWSLIPLGVAEFAAYLSTVLELKQECIAIRGNKFILSDGKEVHLRKTAPLMGLVAGLVGALILLALGSRARIEFLVTLFRQNAIVIGLNIVGVIVLLDIPFMASRIAALPRKP